MTRDALTLTLTRLSAMVRPLMAVSIGMGTAWAPYVVSSGCCVSGVAFSRLLTRLSAMVRPLMAVGIGMGTTWAPHVVVRVLGSVGRRAKAARYDPCDDPTVCGTADV